GTEAPGPLLGLARGKGGSGGPVAEAGRWAWPAASRGEGSWAGVLSGSTACRSAVVVGVASPVICTLPPLAATTDRSPVIDGAWSANTKSLCCRLVTPVSVSVFPPPKFMKVLAPIVALD